MFRHPHWATVVGAFWPRRMDFERFPVEARVIPTQPGVKVLVHTQRPNRGARGEVILVHGLEGSSDAPYMRSMAQTLLEAGFVTHRTNIRFCGGTEALSPTLYHAGLTEDLRVLVATCETPPYVIGYSLGGNQVLKLAGEMGTAAVGRVAGVVAISSPIDLLLCSRKMEQGFAKVYTRRFLKSMRARLQRHSATIEYKVPWERLNQARTIFDFDDCITGPSFGFRGAEHYYETQSAKNFLDGICVPALVIHSMDDPMVDFTAFGHSAFRGNAEITLLLTEHGGHVGFLAGGWGRRFWADEAVRQWLEGFGEGTRTLTL
jgi:uncharacterized protein